LQSTTPSVPLGTRRRRFLILRQITALHWTVFSLYDYNSAEPNTEGHPNFAQATTADHRGLPATVEVETQTNNNMR